jgi:hypothetical protein
VGDAHDIPDRPLEQGGREARREAGEGERLDDAFEVSKATGNRPQYGRAKNRIFADQPVKGRRRKQNGFNGLFDDSFRSIEAVLDEAGKGLQADLTWPDAIQQQFATRSGRQAYVSSGRNRTWPAGALTATAPEALAAIAAIAPGSGEGVTPPSAPAPATPCR